MWAFKNKLLLSAFILLLLVTSSAVFVSPFASAASTPGNPGNSLNGDNPPFFCAYVDASAISCGAFAHEIYVTYYYRTNLSEAAKHPVFSTANDADTAGFNKTYPGFDNTRFGYLHITGTYSKQNIDTQKNITINNSKTLSTGGTKVNDRTFNDSGDALDSIPNAPTGTCSFLVPRTRPTAAGQRDPNCKDNPGAAPNIPGKFGYFQMPSYDGKHFCTWRNASQVDCDSKAYFIDPSYQTGQNDYTTGYMIFRSDGYNNGDDRGFLYVYSPGRGEGFIKAVKDGYHATGTTIKSIQHNTKDNNGDQSDDAGPEPPLAGHDDQAAEQPDDCRGEDDLAPVRGRHIENLLAGVRPRTEPAECRGRDGAPCTEDDDLLPLPDELLGDVAVSPPAVEVKWLNLPLGS